MIDVVRRGRWARGAGSDVGLSGTAVIAPLRIDQRKAALALWQGLWRGGRSTNAEYFRWKFEDNPVPTPNPVQAASVGDKIVGLVAAHGSRWEHDGQEINVACVGDLIVAPDYRGSDVFGRLLDATKYQLAADGYDLAFDFASGRYVPYMMLRGWKGIGAIPTAHACHGSIKDAKVDTPPARSWPWQRPFRRLSGGDGIEVGTESRPAAMASLVQRLGPTSRIRGVRDERFLEWRFANPLADYRFLYAGGRELDGYLVLGFFRPAASQGHVYVVDIEATSVEVRSALLRCALGAGFSTLTIWPGTTDENQAWCESLGFMVERPTGRSLTDIDFPTVLVKQLGGSSDRSADQGAEPDLSAIDRLDGWDPRPVYFDEI